MLPEVTACPLRAQSDGKPGEFTVNPGEANTAPDGTMRAKIPDLTLALEGRFGDHHALMCRPHLDHIGHLDAMRGLAGEDQL